MTLIAVRKHKDRIRLPVHFLFPSGGIRLPLMPPEEAARSYSSAEMATAEKLRRKAIVGSSEQVAAQSLELNKLLTVTLTYDPAPPHRSYELLTRTFGLKM